MEILETIVRSKPIEKGGILRISADTEIWHEIENIETLSIYCLNKFQEEITELNKGTGGYQIRSSDVTEKVDSDVYLGFLSVPENYYDYYVQE